MEIELLMIATIADAILSKHHKLSLEFPAHEFKYTLNEFRNGQSLPVVKKQINYIKI